MKKLYKWNVDFGRMGDLSGLFVADDEDYEAALGKRVYFGEALGKHSEVDVVLEEDQFQMMSDNQNFISEFQRLRLRTGRDPIDMYLDQHQDDEE